MSWPGAHFFGSVAGLVLFGAMGTGAAPQPASGGCPSAGVCISAHGGRNRAAVGPDEFGSAQTCHMVAFRFDRIVDASPVPVRTYGGPSCTGVSVLVPPRSSTSANGSSFTVG